VSIATKYGILQHILCVALGGKSSSARPTFVNKNLDPIFKLELIKLLKEYVNCFAWNYNEMPGLSRDLVEHHLPIKPGFKPYK
jgi:hypothetical protein